MEDSAVPRGGPMTEPSIMHGQVGLESRLTEGRLGVRSPVMTNAKKRRAVTVKNALYSYEIMHLSTKKAHGPFWKAVKSGDVELMISELLKLRVRYNLNEGHAYGDAALQLAAFYGHREIVGLLLAQDGDKSVNVNAADNRGYTPLHRAAYYGDREIVELLLSYDANTSPQNNSGSTPLHMASEEGHIEVVERLLSESSTKAHAVDISGATPLLLATRRGHEGVGRVYLAKDGIEIKSRRSYNETLLRYAVQKGERDVVSLLLEEDHKLNVNLVDDNSQTLLRLAAKNRDQEMTHILLAKDTTTLHLVVKQGDLSLMRYLLTAGYDYETKDALNRLPLHIACLFDRLEIARELIYFGADIDGEDGNGTTPLRLAVLQKKLGFIDLLLKVSACSRSITRTEWLEAYGKKETEVVVLEEGTDDGSTIRFIEAAALPGQLRQIPPQLKLGRRLFNLPNNSPWDAVFLPHSKKSIKPNKLHTFVSDESTLNGGIAFSMACWFPAGIVQSDVEHFMLPDWGQCRISWTTFDHTDGNRRASMDHFSILPNGWLPVDGIDFVAQFLRYFFQERWLKLCDLAEQHLADCRLQQLREKGESRALISLLAQNAQIWEDLRRTLKDQVRTIEAFNTEYRSKHNSPNDRDEVKMILADFTAQVGTRIDRLDQIVRDLLQLEFAWVSITEAHRSTSLAKSMKRLSWVTFIFLPSMFASSLFGMNVSLLKNNPDWRWFLLAGGVCLTSTMCIWLIFKYFSIEAWIEEHVGQRLDRFKKSENTASRSDVSSASQKLP